MSIGSSAATSNMQVSIYQHMGRKKYLFYRLLLQGPRSFPTVYIIQNFGRFPYELSAVMNQWHEMK